MKFHWARRWTQREGGDPLWSIWVRGGGDAKEFSKLFEELNRAKESVETAESDLEGRFLKCSEEVEGLNEARNQFVGQVRILSDLAAGQSLDEGLFGSAYGLIRGASEFLTEVSSRAESALAQLRGYRTEIDTLLEFEFELKRTMMPLRFVQTLFKSESASMGEATAKMFGSLTVEIESMHDQMIEVFGSKFKQLQETKQGICRVIEEMEPQVAALKKGNGSVLRRLQDSVETLRQGLISNMEHEIRLEQLTHDFSNDVDQVVTGLQYQDIVNQKLTHVKSGLPKMTSRFEADGKPTHGDARNDALRYIRQAGRLESRQIRAAENDLMKAESTIRHGIRRALKRVVEMESRCLSMDEFKTLTISADGSVQILLELIEETEGLLAGTEKWVQDGHAALRSPGQSTSDLTRVVREMSRRIQLIGLNAQVQAATTGGRSKASGLEVLSARTSDVSTRTNQMSEEVAERLDRVGSGLASCLKELASLGGDATRRREAFNKEGLVETGKLHEFRDGALNALQTIGTLLEEIRERAGRVQAVVEFTATSPAKLPALREALDMIADRAEQELGTWDEDIDLLGKHREGYTMASERGVYDSVVGGQAAGSVRGGTGSAAATPSIELFDDGEEDNAAAGGAGGKTSVAQAGADGVSGKEETELQGQFGDNVEFF